MAIRPKSSDRFFTFVRVALFCGYILAETVLADIGAAIYQRGETQSGKASIGNQENSAPSTLFPCVNCHGAHGEGSKESGIVAPDISWSQLGQAYRKDLDGGYARAAYNAESFKTAIVVGLNSDGGKLSDSMPRYQLNDAEVTALIGYLKQISRHAEHGVDEYAIHFRLRLPRDHALGDAIRQTVSTYVGTINEQGGIYRRQLVLHEAEGEADQAVFGILDMRLEPSPAKVCEFTILTIFSTSESCGDEYFLYPHPDGFHKLIKPLIEAQGWASFPVRDLDIETILSQLQALPENQLRSLVLIHGRDGPPLAELLTALQGAGLHPRVVVDNLYSAPQNQSILSAYPAPVYGLGSPGPESVSVQGRVAYTRLAQEGNFSSQYLSARLWSLSLMRLLTGALQQTGRNVTQDKFNQVLQSQVDLQTDFGPLLTFTANRRIGNSSVRLVAWRSQ